MPELLIVTMLPSLVLQLPPDTVDVRLEDEPIHTNAEPEMVPADVGGFTTTVCSVLAVPQPLETVYEIVTVPGLTPVTVPELLTVAKAVLLLLHVPPLPDPLRLSVAPWHTLPPPVIVPADGSGLTVIAWKACTDPQLLATV